MAMNQHKLPKKLNGIYLLFIVKSIEFMNEANRVVTLLLP